MRKMRKWAAALLALCLLAGAMGAAAEGDLLNDLLGFYQRATGEEASAEEAVPDSAFGNLTTFSRKKAPETVRRSSGKLTAAMRSQMKTERKLQALPRRPGLPVLKMTAAHCPSAVTPELRITHMYL